jgi:D-arabinose 1-dehydrogenase-like Zn-dependent alcohol dehydrogenase
MFVLMPSLTSHHSHQYLLIQQQKQQNKSNKTKATDTAEPFRKMASLPKTYKAVILPGPNSPFKLTDVELKSPPANQILVKVKACGVCFSDVAVAKGEFGPNVFPRVPGHEIVGDIVAVGSGVTQFKEGDRVGGPWHGGHDGHCRQCQRGQFQMCDNQDINSVTRDGGYAEYVTLRAEAVVRVPKDMDVAEVAPLLCAGVTVFNGIRKLHVEQGHLVAVQGLGGLGHLAVQYARHMGYEVAVLSSGDDKAAFAMELGAHHYINTKTTDAPAELLKLGGASIIVQTAPNPKAVSGLINGLAPGGHLLSLAPVGAVEFDTGVLLGKNASVTGWPSGHALDSEEAIRFANNHGIKCLVERFSLNDVQAAVDSLIAGKPRFRNVLIME